MHIILSIVVLSAIQGISSEQSLYLQEDEVAMQAAEADELAYSEAFLHTTKRDASVDVECPLGFNQ